MEYKYEQQIMVQLKKTHKILISEIANALGTGQDALMRPINSLEEKGFIKKEISAISKIALTEEGKRYFEKWEELPEFRVYKKALEGKTVSELTDEEKKFGIPWAKKKGFVDIIAGKLVPKSAEIVPIPYNSKMIGTIFDAKELAERNIVCEKIEKSIFIEITEKGRHATFTEAETQESIASNLTSEMLRTGTWKEKKFKEYDVEVPVKNAYLGKIHPITHAMERIRHIFAEMGFVEMEGGYIESAFWNFDALFQPQDHPARELADTFYLEGEVELPEKNLVQGVKNVHEKGWNYVWKEGEAKRKVLRTHTTAMSARYLSGIKKGPKKYFAVGRVFRNEATDFKHLAEFHQVEGILAWENATFCDLLGLLKEFYSKLGFKKIRLVPSYFPYTEPSLEIHVYFEEKKEWMELGGAGIMRPEVSIPLANTYPVLAWGLSIERPLMMLMGFDDIRTFYKNDLGWLKKAKVKL